MTAISLGKASNVDATADPGRIMPTRACCIDHEPIQTWDPQRETGADDWWMWPLLALSYKLYLTITESLSAICDFLRREDELMTELMNHKRSTS
jgi:hypothetical protein